MVFLAHTTDIMTIHRFSLLLSLIGALAVGCGAAEPSPSRPDTKLSVKVAPAHEEPFAALYRASGTVRGRNTAVLTSKTTGYVRAVRVKAGDRVTAGQVLAELEANDMAAGVRRARAAQQEAVEAQTEAKSGLEAARVAAKIAKTTRDRLGALLERGAIAQQEFDDVEAKYRAAVATETMAEARLRGSGSSIAEARAALAQSQASLDYASIVAPFAGRVIERRVDPGALASPGAALLVVEDDGGLRVEASVEESRAGSLALGDEALVELDSLKAPVSARVSEIVPNVDIASRAFLVKVDLPQDLSSLRPGTFARVGFRVGTRERLVVPTSAIISIGALDRVFVVDGDRAHQRMITWGERQGDWTEVLSGLSPNERVVVVPPPELTDGDAVAVRQ